MNRKLFFGMFAAAGMLLAASCSNDELYAVQSGDEAQVTFSLGLEDGMATRAISDGKSAKKLVCAIYDADYEVISTISINGSAVDENGQYVNESAFAGGLTDKVNVTLAKGQTYTMVFWAQNSECDAYTTTDLTEVKVDYDGVNNDETRDAFYAAETFKVEGDKVIDVKLKRPFAQINVGVYESDWNAAVASGIEIEKSSVVIRNAATSINLLTGEVGAEATDVVVHYSADAIPSGEMLKVDVNNDGSDEEFHWLSMSYILVADHDSAADANGLLGTDRANLLGLQYSFIPKSGQTISFAEGLANAPVQRNWRTNILGKILTGDVQFNITIDPAYDGDYIYPSTLEEELKFAATFGGTVTLNENVELTEPLNVNADMILYMGGHTLTGSVTVSEGFSLLVENGSIVNTNDTVSGIASNGSLTLNDVNVTSARHALRIESGDAVINGGTYSVNPASSKTLHALNVGDDNTTANVTIKNGTFIGPKGTIADSGSAVAVKAGSTVTIEGGDFFKGKNSTLSSKGTMIIAGGSFDQEPKADWIAEGYQAIQTSGVWHVVSNKIDAVVADATTLANEVKNGKKNIYLLDGEYDIKDCKGSNFSINGSSDAIITVVGAGQGEANGQLDYDLDGSTVIFNGVTIKTNNQTYAGYARLKATYNNVTFENCYCLNGSSNFNNCTLNVSGDQYNIWTWGAPEAEFTGCTFNSDGKAMLLYSTVNTKLTINNSTFNDNGGLTDLKAAIEIGNDYDRSYELIVNNTTVNGYEINDKGFNTGTTLWANKNSMGTDKLNVVVDGVDVY